MGWLGWGISCDVHVFLFWHVLGVFSPFIAVEVVCCVGLNKSGHVLFPGLRCVSCLHDFAYLLICEADIQVFFYVSPCLRGGFMSLSFGCCSALLWFVAGGWDWFEAHPDPSGVAGFVITWVIPFAIDALGFFVSQVIIHVVGLGAANYASRLSAA